MTKTPRRVSPFAVGSSFGVLCDNGCKLTNKFPRQGQLQHAAQIKYPIRPTIIRT